MELWIRSQDRKRLIKIYDDINIVIDPVYKDWCIETKIGQDYIEKIAYHTVTNDIKIATYLDEKRALEVLDEIQNKICPVDLVNIGYGTIVYEMPKE